MERIAQAHGMAPAVVHSLATFYYPQGVPPATKVCTGLPCALRGSAEARERLEADGLECGGVACLGYCDRAPVVEKQGTYYTLAPNGLHEIEESRAAFVEAHAEGLAEYVRAGGYDGLKAVLKEEDHRRLLAVVEKAGLRGMGGAGFPAHLKWRAVSQSPIHDRVVLVNGHEGEPGTFKDRVIMERSPHLVLEGALIAAHVVGAGRVVIALKTEYRPAASVMGRALHELETFVRESGMSDQLPLISIQVVGGPYVTGEETALLEALEGRRGEPRLRPPFPAEVGLAGKPTLVQNVETLTLLPSLFSHPEEHSFRKVYCLTGDIAKPGAYTEHLGIPAASLLEKEGGGTPRGLKAFLPGGLSGGLLPASKVSVSLDFEPVKREGCGLGTGAVISIGEDRCIVEVLDIIGGFFAAESCGKCAPCRLGTLKLSALMASLRQGRATPADLEEGRGLAALMQETSLCALGQVAGKTFSDALKHLEDEIVAHTRGSCPAGTCPIGGE